MPLQPLPDVMVEPVVRSALAEDLGQAGDVTSRACIEPGARLSARLVARAPGILAGLACARLALAALAGEDHRFEALGADGDALRAGQPIAAIEAPAQAVLTAERTALNLLCHLSGIATLAAAYVRAIAGTKARIVDTRKTTPGLRALEKYAVRCGGGFNHRFGLSDAALIKDNHIAACGSLTAAFTRARAVLGHMTAIEVEVDNLGQLDEALTCGAARILLDNFTIAELEAAVRNAAGRAILEASGGVTLETVGAIAATGVDLISVGALTHSAPALDIGLDAG